LGIANSARFAEATEPRPIDTATVSKTVDRILFLMVIMISLLWVGADFLRPSYNFWVARESKLVRDANHKGCDFLSGHGKVLEIPSRSAPQELRQVGDVGGYAPRLVPSHGPQRRTWFVRKSDRSQSSPCEGIQPFCGGGHEPRVLLPRPTVGADQFGSLLGKKEIPMTMQSKILQSTLLIAAAIGMATAAHAGGTYPAPVRPKPVFHGPVYAGPPPQHGGVIGGGGASIGNCYDSPGCHQPY
jgi:hypothetical protein